MENTMTCSSQDTAGKKPTRHQTTIKLPMYQCKVVIVIVDSVKAEVDKIYKKHKLKEEFEGEAEGALVHNDIDCYYLFIGTQFITHNTIAHEIFHAAVRITEDRDITDEETQAWLAGHITETLYKFLEKRKLQVKHG